MSIINLGMEELINEPLEDESMKNTNNTSVTPSGVRAMLHKAVCDEFTAEYQYIIAEHIARGAGYCDVTPEYKQHAEEEHDHALKLLKRLEQLDEKFTLDLAHVQTDGNPWVPIVTSSITEQLDILIKAEKDAQVFYNKIIDQARTEHDEITVRLMKELLTDECEHETDLKRIREQF